MARKPPELGSIWCWQDQPMIFAQVVHLQLASQGACWVTLKLYHEHNTFNQHKRRLPQRLTSEAFWQMVEDGQLVKARLYQRRQSTDK